MGRTSISTTSGRAHRTASAPSPASPTAVDPGVASTNTRKLPRTNAWSSATSTRITLGSTAAIPTTVIAD